jgi:hypothetical protein
MKKDVNNYTIKNLFLLRERNREYEYVL